MTRVAIVDDHPLFTTSLGIALRARGVEVEQPSLAPPSELVDALLASRPDAVLLDRDLGPFGNGEDLIQPLAAARGRVVITSASLDDVVAGRCLARGAIACIAKSDPFEAALATLQSVAQGGNPLPDAERYRLVDQWRRWQAKVDEATAPFASLTPREAWVLSQLMEGRSVRSLVDESYLAEATVRTHVHRILMKLAVKSQAEAIALASRSGWECPVPSIAGLRTARHARDDRAHPT